MAYLSIISFAGAEQSLQRVVARDDESSHVYEELASNVEENKEEINANKAEEGVNLWNRRLLLEVVECRVLGQLERTLYQPMSR